TASGAVVALSFDPAQISGLLDLGANARRFTVNSTPFILGPRVELIVGAAISGTSPLIKSGAGEMELISSNAFTGAVTVEGGSFIAADQFALGSGAAGVVITNNATLQLAAGVTTSRPLTLHSASTSPGALFSS